MYRHLSFFIFLVATTALAQTPIIQTGGDDCPPGFYSTGSYCKRISSSNREAIPGEDGGKCPTGWYKPGGYCVKQDS